MGPQSNRFRLSIRKKILQICAAVLLLFLGLVFDVNGQQMSSGRSGAAGNIQLNSSSTRMNSEEDGSDTAVLSKQAAVAYTTEDYPVTPGDVYRLTYFRSLTPTVQSLVVENDMQINLGVLGSFNAAGLTFDQAKDEIMAIVERSYSDSSSKVTIQGLGTFPVLVKGEVKTAGFVNVNGLSRLSSVVNSRSTDHASTRRVRVVGRDGNSKEYDLFQAGRNGDMSQNPYLRPGDTVELRRAERRVSVQGEVYRRGSYQLQPGEQLTELIERYADGLTATALPTEVQITRTGDSPRDETSSLYVDLTDPEQQENISLSDGDRVVVPSKMQYRPVVYFEGALVSDAELQASEATAEEGASSTGKTSRYTRITYSFEPGERLSTALKEKQPNYRLESDLQGAFLVRSDHSETVAVNIESYLLERQSKDPVLKNGDTIVIPFKQLSVVVSGAVKSPGLYNYVQGRSYEYYVSLAGGVDKSQHWFGEHPKITDDAGNRLADTAVIKPEYRIHYSHNNPFRIITPVAATLSTIVSTILVVQNLVQ